MLYTMAQIKQFHKFRQPHTKTNSSRNHGL